MNDLTEQETLTAILRTIYARTLKGERVADLAAAYRDLKAAALEVVLPSAEPEWTTESRIDQCFRRAVGIAYKDEWGGQSCLAARRQLVLEFDEETVQAMLERLK